MRVKNPIVDLLRLERWQEGEFTRDRSSQCFQIVHDVANIAANNSTLVFAIK